MGMEVWFNLIDAARVRDELIPALVEGRALPASTFDQRPGADEVVAKVRRALADGAADDAAELVSKFVILWSSESLPAVSVTNLGMTYHPTRMESELTGLPTCGLGSPIALFGELRKARSGLHFPSRLRGDNTVGGFAMSPEVTRLRRFYDKLSPERRRRVINLLALFRAAERHGLQVWESASPHIAYGPNDESIFWPGQPSDALLFWPGLERFGLSGGPLSENEWAIVATHVDSWPASDRHDLLDRVAQLLSDSPFYKAITTSLGASKAKIRTRGRLLGLEDASKLQRVDLQRGDRLYYGATPAIFERAEPQNDGQTKFRLTWIASGTVVMVDAPIGLARASFTKINPANLCLPPIQEDGEALLEYLSVAEIGGELEDFRHSQAHCHVAMYYKTLFLKARIKKPGYGSRTDMERSRETLEVYLADALGISKDQASQRIDAALAKID